MVIFPRYPLVGLSRLTRGYYLLAFLAFFLILMMGCGGGGGGSSGASSGGGGGSPDSGGVIHLAWDSNTEEDLGGYRVHFGTYSGIYDHSIDVGMAASGGNSTTYALMNLIKGQTYCIAVTAYDTSNNESDFSDEVCGNAG
jgi:hypothetical protein